LANYKHIEAVKLAKDDFFAEVPNEKQQELLQKAMDECQQYVDQCCPYEVKID
jgi:hypothetical protein